MESKPVIAVSGKDGQLGWELQQQASLFSFFDFKFYNRKELDITNTSDLAFFFERERPSYFINCAAYTGVDKAETEQEAALNINAVAVGNIAQLCSKYNTVFISFSSDYVFDGNATQPYRVNAITNPVNYYGYTKRLGEQLILENCLQSIVIRTSWVYSVHGNNFVKTMLRLMNERESVNVVNDQVGAPTYAADLANITLSIINQISSGNKHFGIYHYSNGGAISWFDFALCIKQFANLACNVHPIPSSAFPTPAKRPGYSVFDTSALQKDYHISPIDWQVSLKKCLQLLGY